MLNNLCPIVGLRKIEVRLECYGLVSEMKTLQENIP